MIKQIGERNEQRRKEFVEKKAREDRLLDLYLKGFIMLEKLQEKLKE